MCLVFCGEVKFYVNTFLLKSEQIKENNKKKELTSRNLSVLGGEVKTLLNTPFFKSLKPIQNTRFSLIAIPFVA